MPSPEGSSRRSGYRGAGIALRSTGPIVIGLLVVLVAVLWIAFRPQQEPLDRFLGQLIGVEGMLLLSIGLVLISALRIVEQWFDGVDRAAIWHRGVAIAGTVLIAVHAGVTTSTLATTVGTALGAVGRDRTGRARGVGDRAALALLRAQAAAGRRSSRSTARGSRAPSTPGSRATRSGVPSTVSRGCSWRSDSCTAWWMGPCSVHRCCVGAMSPSGRSDWLFYAYRELLARRFAADARLRGRVGGTRSIRPWQRSR